MKKRTVDEIPPELCPIPKEDKVLFDNLKKDELTTIYVGTVKVDSDYKDIYVIITQERIPYILAVRRVCLDKKFLEKKLGVSERSGAIE